jgi:demethylmenaquinone methyltransferase / 2-methoxy-6-polyprenyl-1,4-benzoquinol methylase
MDDLRKEYQNQKLSSDHAKRVCLMFEKIARRYDLLNHLLSCNIDKRWRRLVVQVLQRNINQQGINEKDAFILDVACGTGDLTISLSDGGFTQVVGLDFCRPMLEIANRKASSLPFIEGDALQLPFADVTFNAATIAFGLRNLSSVEDGLKELWRVLKPGGQVAVLEFSKPTIPGFRELFQFYFMHVLPRIGGIVSGSRGAYEYLPSSVSKFPDQKELVQIMHMIGFTDIQYKNLTGGIAALHIGKRSH